VPPTKLKDGYAESHTASIYGRETYYEPRAQSPAPSQFGMGYAPPGYQSGRNTPQSYLRPLSDANMLYQPSPSRPATHYQDTSRPVTNYLDSGLPVMQSPVDDITTGGPSDADLDRAVQDVLRRADLNSVTKREVRRQLEEYFGLDLTARKATINAAIDRVLLSHT